MNGPKRKGCEKPSTATSGDRVKIIIATDKRVCNCQCMKTMKAEVIKAGYDISSRCTPPQQENHRKVLTWVESLNESEIPDYSQHREGREAGALLSYKCLIPVWMKTVHNN